MHQCSTFRTEVRSRLEIPRLRFIEFVRDLSRCWRAAGVTRRIGNA
jgi:hypothetical protein